VNGNANGNGNASVTWQGRGRHAKILEMEATEKKLKEEKSAIEKKASPTGHRRFLESPGTKKVSPAGQRRLHHGARKHHNDRGSVASMVLLAVSKQVE